MKSYSGQMIDVRVVCNIAMRIQRQTVPSGVLHCRPKGASSTNSTSTDTWKEMGLFSLHVSFGHFAPTVNSLVSHHAWFTRKLSFTGGDLLKLVFTSDGVGVVVGVVRALST